MLNHGTLLIPKGKVTDHAVTIDPPVDYAEDFYSYAKCYKKAAWVNIKILFNAQRPSIASLDTHFFAIAFLYRHSIELLLKSIALSIQHDRDQRILFVKNTFHNLKEMLTRIVSALAPLLSDKEISWLTDYFSDLSSFDKESDSFRYPYHIDSWQNDFLNTRQYKLMPVFTKQTNINLMAFIKKFETSFKILEKWHLHDVSNVENVDELSTFFLEEGGPYYRQSVVGYRYNSIDYYPYIKAYSETAGNLKRTLLEQYDSQKDHEYDLFFPMCYLYRNCIELLMKYILMNDIKDDWQKRLSVVKKKKHSISGLWQAIKPHILSECENSGPASYLDDLEEYCIQIHNFDPDAGRFRYPCDKNLEPYFAKKMTINMEDFADFLESTCEALENIHYELAHINEVKEEIERAYQQDNVITD